MASKKQEEFTEYKVIVTKPSGAESSERFTSKWEAILYASETLASFHGMQGASVRVLEITKHEIDW